MNGFVLGNVYANLISKIFNPTNYFWVKKLREKLYPV